MMTNKTELVKQVNWALRSREPIGFRAVSEVTAKWKPAGCEVRFDGSQAVIAHLEGRIVAIAWQQMGDVERHLFAKDCDELLHRDVKELGHFDHGYLESLFHLLKEGKLGAVLSCQVLKQINFWYERTVPNSPNPVGGIFNFRKSVFFAC